MDEGQFLESIVARLLQQNPGMSPEEARRLAAARLQRPAVAAAPEQRIEGAPGIELGARARGAPMAPGWNEERGAATQAFDRATEERGALPGTAPPSVIDLMETRADQMRRGHSSNPKPGGVGWQEEGDLLKWEEGMTEEEFQARLQGFESAESMRKWREWVAADPQRMQRYDPEGFAAMTAAQNAEADRKHAQYLRDRYGAQGSLMAEEFLRARAEGRAPDGDVFRSPMEREASDQHMVLENMARGFIDGGGISPLERRALGIPMDAPVPTPEERREMARRVLRDKRNRSGYLGAIGGWEGSHAKTQDGTETYKDRFNRNIARRKAEKEARLDILRNQNLLGRAPTPIAQANAFSLAQDPDMDEQSRRALLNTLPGAELGAQVDAANLERAADLSAQAIRGFAGMIGLGGEQAGTGDDGPNFDAARERVDAGEYNHPEVLAYADQLVRDKYSDVQWFGNTSTFSDQEVVDAAADLVLQFPNLPEEEALRIMRDIQAQRGRNFTNPLSRIFY
jgi:hypothetical protein